MSLRIAGIYPSAHVSNDIDIRSCVAEPLGLGKVLSAVQSPETEIMYDMAIDCSNAEMLSRIEKFDPDVVAFSLLTCHVPVAIAMADHLKTQRPDRIVLAGGYHPSAMESVESPFDGYIVGEGEIPFQQVVKALSQGRDWRSGPGLLVGNRRTGMPARIERMEMYPWARRDARMLKDNYVGLVCPTASLQTGFAFVEHTRGCMSKCTFCCKNVIWDNKLTFRDPRDVVAEMLQLQNEREVNLFFFSDLNFTVCEARVVELCREMKREGISAKWFCMSNVGTATTEVLEAMADAGCVKVMYGVESVDKRTRHNVHKAGSYARIKRVMEETLDLGMLPHAFYMLGFPWETQESILAAIEPLMGLSILQLRIAFATPFPGSAWYNEIKSRVVASDLSLFDCEHLVFKHNHFSDASLRLTADTVYREFYHSKSYQKRVEKFVNRWPHYQQSFKEFFELLKHDKGINVPIF